MNVRMHSHCQICKDFIALREWDVTIAYLSYSDLKMDCLYHVYTLYEVYYNSVQLSMHYYISQFLTSLN